MSGRADPPPNAWLSKQPNRIREPVSRGATTSFVARESARGDNCSERAASRGGDSGPRGRGRGRGRGGRGRGAPRHISWDEWGAQAESSTQSQQRRPPGLTVGLQRPKGADTQSSIGCRPKEGSLHPPLPPGDVASFEQLPLLTNELPMELTPEQKVYRYAVAIESTAQGKTVNLLEGDSDLAAVVRRNDLAIALLMEALRKYDILSANGAFVYDAAATLLVNESISAALKPHNCVLTVVVSDLPEAAQNLLLKIDGNEFRVRLQAVNCSTIGDMMRLAKHGVNEDQPLRQFLEILTNRSKRYAFVGQGTAVHRSRQSSVNAMLHTRECISKGAVIIEGQTQSDDLCAVLNLDACKSVFYTECALDEFMRKVLHVRESATVVWDKARQQKVRAELRGLRVFSKDRSRTFTIADVVSDAQSTRRADAETRTRLEQWPVIVGVAKAGAAPPTMHADALVLAPFQKVQQGKLSESTRPVAVQPKDRWRMLTMHLGALDLASDSSTLKSFGVQVKPEFLKIRAYRRLAPTLSDGKGAQIHTNKDDGGFEPNFVLARPALIHTLYIVVDPACQLGKAEISGFRARLEQRMKELAIRVSCWVEVYSNINDELEEGGKVFQQAILRKKGLSTDSASPHILIMYIDDLKTPSHSLLKLAESRFQIVTQHITAQTVLRTNTRDTSLISNILLKLNVKMGGLNYAVQKTSNIEKLLSNTTLIIGYDVWHPTGAPLPNAGIIQLPSVVGVSGNCGRSMHDYIGDYSFQDSFQEEVAERVLTENMQWMLRMWVKNRSKKYLPEKVIVFRDGVSRGQYEMVIKKELPALRKACAAFGKDSGKKNYDPKFVVIVCTKRHNQRFALDRDFENTPLGTAIDRTVVHQDVTEFFLQTHHPVVGTTSIPKYQMLVSDVEDLTQDELQELIIALAYEHQISTNSISVPEPINQADEWANRGSNNLRQYIRLKMMEVSKNGEPIDYSRLSKILSQKGKPLEGIRINA